MKIQIETLKKLNNELDTINFHLAENLKNAKEIAKTKTITVTRNGEEVEVTEKDLFDELYWNANTDAREILKEKYPAVFDLEKQSFDKAKEIKDFSLKEFGFTPEKMNLTNLIDLIIKLKNYNEE